MFFRVLELAKFTLGQVCQNQCPRRHNSFVIGLLHPQTALPIATVNKGCAAV